MARIAGSIWVEASPEVVFRTIAEPVAPLLPKGGPRLAILDTPGAVGSRYRWEFHRLGFHFRLDSEVTESRFGERLAFRSLIGWEMEAETDLQAERGGTRLTYRMRYRFPAPLRWLIPGPLIRLGVWHGLHKIKAMAEESVRVRVLMT